MSVWPLVPLPIVAAAVAIAGLASGNVRDTVLSLAPLAAGGLLLVSAGFRVHVDAPQLIGIDGFGWVVEGALILWVLDDVRTGRAHRLRAARIRFQFDRKLHRELERPNAVSRGRPASSEPTASDAWRDSYSRAVELAATMIPPAPDRAPGLTELNRHVSERVLALRRAYEAEARGRGDGAA